ncbi:MAG: iron ion binding protein [Parcubacteria group bacterium Athens0714_26]|nr:MAG: iron ion binding protein [Parcubacteria group bacterium Athens1014_26]TSD03029.1 MAG: iron ion binding protein [Parcubacteria group bacterium Athens0714_26]
MPLPERKNTWLLDYQRNITSQFGEDGIIEKIFEVIGVDNKWCVEFGALNGRHHSNTWNLINNKGWSAALIEADPFYFEKLKAFYENNKNVTCLNEFINFEGESSLDNVLSCIVIPKTFDLLSIDIDGNDYHVWDSLKLFSPKVVIIEFNPSIPLDIAFAQPRDMKIQQGSSLLSIVELGKVKEYELVAVTEANAIFVKKEFFKRFGIADNSPAVLWQNHKYETKLFQLFDGTLVLRGCDRLIWHNKKIDPEKIQVLPRSKRFYPAGINSKKSVRLLKSFFRKLWFYSLIKKFKK